MPAHEEPQPAGRDTEPPRAAATSKHAAAALGAASEPRRRVDPARNLDALGRRLADAVSSRNGARDGLTFPRLQRMPVVSDHHARDEVRAELIRRGYQTEWRALIAGIGSRTILDIGVDRVVRFLVQQSNNVALVVRVINNTGPGDLQTLGEHMDGALFREVGALVAPDELQVGRAYATFLEAGRDARHLADGAFAAGGPRYVPGMYGRFRARMLADGGQYWDDAAQRFRPLSQAFLAHRAVAATGAAAFSGQIYGGQQVDLLTGALAPTPGWQVNRDTAVGRELSLFLNPVPLPLTRTFNPATLAAVARLHARPAAPQAIIAGGANVGPTLSALVTELASTANPEELLTVLDHAIGTPGGLVQAVRNLPILGRAAPQILALRAHTLVNLPFTRVRAGGLRGHFLKHVLGGQTGLYAANGLWESALWMTRLNLAPNGAITKANLPNLVAASHTGWQIFGQHDRWFASYAALFYRWVVPASRPTNAAETTALIAYLASDAAATLTATTAAAAAATAGNAATAAAQAAAAAGSDATAVAAAHEHLYEQNVSTAFDAAPHRYLYVEGNALKVNAHDGTLFMVAAWNAPPPPAVQPPTANFDLSTGFIINPSPLIQYGAANALRIMDL